MCELFPPSYECSMGCVTALCSALPRCRAFARFPRFPRCFPRCRAFRAAFRAFGFALCSLGALRAAFRAFGFALCSLGAFRAAFCAFGFALCSLGAFRAAALSALLSATWPRWDARLLCGRMCRLLQPPSRMLPDASWTSRAGLTAGRLGFSLSDKELGLALRGCNPGGIIVWPGMQARNHCRTNAFLCRKLPTTWWSHAQAAAAFFLNASGCFSDVSSWYQYQWPPVGHLPSMPGRTSDPPFRTAPEFYRRGSVFKTPHRPHPESPDSVCS